ncbi:MAG TPA: M28 family peptidase [Verrucomicrobiae bacterium]
MKTIFLQVLVLSFCLGLARAGWCEHPTKAADSLVLARVELAGPAESYSLPVHALLQDSAGRDYMLVFSAEEDLVQAGWPWRVLARDIRPEDCLLATWLRPAAHEYAVSHFMPLHDDGVQLLVRASDAEAEELADAGLALQRLDSEPITWSKRQPPRGESGSWPKLLADPLVTEMLGSIQTTNLYRLLARLTGSEPELASGAPCLITTRNTSSGAPLTNALDSAFQRLQALGLAPFYHRWTTSTRTNRNLVANLPGTTHSNELVLITAHLDDAPSGAVAPGADDNASGSVCVLVAAGVCARYQFERTIRFVLFTGEEQGLYGSKAYAATLQQAGENVTGVINLDMLGWSSLSARTFQLHIRAATNSGYAADLALASVFTNVVTDYGLRTELTPVIKPDSLPNSDHASFWNRGFAALAATEDYTSDFTPYYHTINDTLRTLNWRYYTAAVRAGVGTVALLAGPLGPVPSDVLEVANSDWNPGSAVGGTAFLARHSPSALESGLDVFDLALSNAPANPKPQWLQITSSPYDTPLLADSRPPDSQSLFLTSLSVGAPPDVQVSCSNKLRFDFLSPPAPDRIYLARIRLSSQYTPGRSDFLCVTNLRDVSAQGGFVGLPGLSSVPANTNYGTCEISCRFLDTTAAACPLRFISATESNVVLGTEAQVGVKVFDEVLFSPTLDGTNWSPVASFTNDVAADAASFELATQELLLPVEVPAGSAPARFFRLKRTWLAP